MSAPFSSLPIHRSPASSSKAAATRNAATRRGNQTALPPPPPPLAHPPKLPQRPTGSPASRFHEQFRLAGLFTFRCRLRRKIPQSLHAHLLQALPSHYKYPTRASPPLVPPKATAVATMHPYPLRLRSGPPSAHTSVSDRSSILSHGTATSRTSPSSCASL